ncbi:hypothetical protein BD779DRAFT_1469589 [Infundibulicybe gibba]|nr:hypothetical protein BD779DRAFT_1469589 [Infundibulicybe gibba]
MYGRDAEINKIVRELIQQANTGASIAILGPGGIGKTSIALSVMHGDRICSKYESNRVFISCEAVTSIDAIVSDLASALQVSLEGIREPISAISAQLRRTPHLIILDNFETPWDLPHVRSEAEGLLANLAAVEMTSVLVTARGSQYPAGVKWTQSYSPVHFARRYPPTPTARAFLQGYYIDLAHRGSIPNSDTQRQFAQEFQYQQAELKASDVSGQANDLHNLACLYMRQPGSLNKPREKFLAAIALRDRIHDWAGKADDLMGIGQFHLQISETKATEGKLLEALSLYNQIGDNLGQASALNTLGRFSTAQPNCDNAEMYYTKALSLNIAGGNIVGQAESLAGLARVSLIQSQFDKARAKIDESISLHSPAHYADHLLTHGRVLIVELKYEEARHALNHAAELHAAAGDRLGSADDALYLAFIYLQRPNSFDKASEMALKSLGEYQAVDNISGRGSAFATLAMLDIRRGLDDQALKKLETALVFHRQVNNLLGEALDHYYIGYAQLQSARYEQALTSLNRAFELNVKTGNIQGQAENKTKIAEVLL